MRIKPPPHINTEPCPAWERQYMSPCQYPLPTTETATLEIERRKPTDMERLHVWSCWKRTLPGKTFMGILGFQTLIFCALQLLAQQWWKGGLMLLLTLSLVLAPYYAQNDRISHRLARLIRQCYYISFSRAGSGNPPTRFLRILPIMAIPVISILLVFWP